MSLILEALKKSETRRRLGEAPDLGTPFTVARRRRNPWPLIVILIAVAAGLGWWYVRTKPSPPSGNTAGSTISPIPAQTRSAAAGAAVPNAQQLPAQPAMRTPPTNTTPLREATMPGQPKSAVAAAPDGTARPSGDVGAAATAASPEGRTTPPGSRPMNRHLPVPAAANSAPAASNPSPPAAAVRSSPPTSERTEITTPAQAPVKPAADSVVAQPAAAKDAKASPEPTPAPNSPDTAAPLPLYYELPYAIRKDIPQMGVSMHVFAADAAARFVVIDGERKVEGDAFKDGLVLREIRPDGIVFEFRGQRFFYPRPGR